MSKSDNHATLSVDILIIGAGPAGATLTGFLGYYGITGLLISRDTTTAPQPHAHLTNAAAWECLRDIGLEDEFRGVSLPKGYYGDYRFCNTLSGLAYLRLYSFTRNPNRLGDYEQASPCAHADVSQNVGEPNFIKYANQHGFPARFGSQFPGYTVDDAIQLITSTVLDQATGTTFEVVSKYLCGADGASSLVAKQAALTYHTLSTGGGAMNVWYEAYLVGLYRRNPGLLHAVSTPLIDIPNWAVRGVNRVIRPYHEFVMSLVAGPGVTSIDVPESEVLAPGSSCWAEVFTNDNVFCLGDTIHKHPPGNGLGSNTCIQDAYNLAWKIAYVIQGKAGPKLLDTYSQERQPVAKRIVNIANDTFRLHAALYKILGLSEPDVQSRKAALDTLKSASPEGVARRAAVRKAQENVQDEVTGLGAEMNQAYVSSAVCLDDETRLAPSWIEGSAGVQHHVISTYPGSRLPHAWFGTRKFGEKLSSHDLSGKGYFTLFTGISGVEKWSAAAESAMGALPGSPAINVRCIGPGQEYSDLYMMWEERKGVEEDGAVLVRPDRTVAWRAVTSKKHARLEGVMRRILAWD